MNKKKTKALNNEKYKLKNVIYDDKCLEMPFFEDLINDLSEKGIKARKAGTSVNALESLYICAEPESIKAAKDKDIAFVCCKTQDRDAECIIEGFDEVDTDFIIKMYQRKHAQPWLICETDRLIIREFSMTDGLDIFPEKSDHPDYNELYIKNIYGFFGYGIWAVIYKESGEIIGRAGLMNSERLDGIELGYEIFEGFRGRGFAVEACKGIIGAAAKRYGIEKLYAMSDIHNAASIRVLERLGFRKYAGEQTGYEEVVNEPGIAKYMLNIVDNSILRV